MTAVKRVLFWVDLMPSDVELLRSYQAERTDGTFRQIVQRHGPMVLYACLRRLGNMHDAEDAAQETFAALARQAAGVKGSLSGWLHAVALHTANQMIRTRVRRVRREHELVHMHKHSTSSQGEETDWKEEIDSALVELPDVLREAVILRYLEGLKHEEAAERTGCPVSTTAWRSDKGLNQLRSILARRGVLLSVGALATLLLQEAAATAAGAGAAVATLTASAKVAGGASAPSTLGTGAMLKAPWIAAMTTVVATVGIGTSVALWPTPPPPTVQVAQVNRPAATFNAGNIGLRGHHFALNDRFLATGNTDRTITLWDRTNGAKTFTLGGTADDGTIALAFSPTQNLLATAGDAGVVKLWDLETRREVAALPAQARPSQMNSLAFSPDGKLLACGGWNATIIVYDVATRRQLHSLRHADGVTNVRFSPDGKLLASASYDGAIKVWNASSGNLLKTIAAHPGGGWSGLAFSPSGVLASGGMDNLVKLWNWTDGTLQATLPGHAGPVLSVCWSNDGSLLASGGKDSRTLLWDARTHQLVADYQCGDQVLQVQFTPDGKDFVTGGWNPRLHLWNVLTPASR